MHKIDIPPEILARTMRARGRDHIFERIDPARTAHIVVDLRNGFMAEGAPVEVPTASEIVPNVNGSRPRCAKLAGSICSSPLPLPASGEREGPARSVGG
jgi:ureidoacrylate peracid hydrolase